VILVRAFSITSALVDINESRVIRVFSILFPLLRPLLYDENIGLVDINESRVIRVFSILLYDENIGLVDINESV
jgi:hypothetical protein